MVADIAVEKSIPHWVSASRYVLLSNFDFRPPQHITLRVVVVVTMIRPFILLHKLNEYIGISALRFTSTMTLLHSL